VSAIIPISCDKPACLIGALRVGRSATIAARDGCGYLPASKNPIPARPHPIRTEGDSITRFDQIEIVPLPCVRSESIIYRFHRSGYQHEEIANDHHN
jgi:hypothetical protein